MSATAVTARSATSVVDPRPWPPQRLARVTGVLYLVLVGVGMFGPLTLESLLVPGNAAETAAGIRGSQGLFDMSLVAWVVIVAVDVAISLTLYLLLTPARRGLSLATAVFRLVYSATLASLLVHLFEARQLIAAPGEAAGDPTLRALSALETFSSGFLVALVFFGVHLVLLGVLVVRSGYLPRVLGMLLVAGGIGYVMDSLASLMVEGYGGLLAALLLTPAVLGEVGLTVWLLAKGVAARGDQQGAAAPSSPLRRSRP